MNRPPNSVSSFHVPHSHNFISAHRSSMRLRCSHVRPPLSPVTPICTLQLTFLHCPSSLTLPTPQNLHRSIMHSCLSSAFISPLLLPPHHVQRKQTVLGSKRHCLISAVSTSSKNAQPQVASRWRRMAAAAAIAANFIARPADAVTAHAPTTPVPVTGRVDKHCSQSKRITAISTAIAPKAPQSASIVVRENVEKMRRKATEMCDTILLALQSAREEGQDEEQHDGHHAAVNDALVLLLTTVIIVPLARRSGISPILGFLAAGIALGPNGFELVRDVGTSKALAELGVVFFLFEMGLELSTSKLKSLGGDVFGLGTVQFFVTGALISIASVMAGMNAQAAIVIGAGMALSSSAFVLQLLGERGEVGTRFGRAAFGILLFQDLAVVPVLVLTPLLTGPGGAGAVVKAISVASAKAVAALFFIFFMGKNLLQPVFRFVAKAKSSEAFIAVILFTVLGTSSLTQMLGLSDTLGAFLAGVMLAETRFRHQVEADIKPFRGLLLGLFFITVGFSIDLNLAWANLGTVASLVTGLLALKAGVTAAAGVASGLSIGSALRTGLLLAQGGEFAFVIYGLGQRVGVLPGDLSQLLLLVVALSMAMTPFLAAVGRRISSSLEKKRGLIGVRMEDADTADARDFVMVAGWGRVGQSVCEMLDAKLVRYMAFDMSPTRVIDARNKGLPVFFGDACHPEVLRSAGVERARAVVVTLDEPEQALRAVRNIRREFEGIQVFCRARDRKHQKLLQAAGATAIVPELLEASLLLGGAVLLDYGTPIEEVNALIEEARASNLGELGVADSIPATLGSAFRQLQRLDIFEKDKIKEGDEELLHAHSSILGDEEKLSSATISDVLSEDTLRRASTLSDSEDIYEPAEQMPVLLDEDIYEPAEPRTVAPDPDVYKPTEKPFKKTEEPSSKPIVAVDDSESDSVR